MGYRPADYSSSEDDFFDDLEYEDYVHEQKKNDNLLFNALTEEQKKERQLRNLQFNLTNGKVQEVLAELDNGWDVNVKLSEDWTPLLLAASVANYNLLQILHERGADVKARKDGQTALMLACNCPNTTTPYEKSAKVVELLLGFGLDPDAINRKRVNALMYAAHIGNLHAVKLLLPVTKITYDNQNWNALFWAVNGGHIDVVLYLIDQGLPFDRVDVRCNTVIDIARDNEFDEIIDLFMSEEDDDVVIVCPEKDFATTFKDLKPRDRPSFLVDFHKILCGTRCESLTKIFILNDTTLLSFLSSTERDLESLGMKMSFQRRRLMTGIYRFHKKAYHPKSVPTVGRSELYCNIDTAKAILSSVKQITCMEASLKYITRNIDGCEVYCADVEKSLNNIEGCLAKMKVIITGLSKKATNWDLEIKQVSLINYNSGKRWIPWRKTCFTLSMMLLIANTVGKRLDYFR